MVLKFRLVIAAILECCSAMSQDSLRQAGKGSGQVSGSWLWITLVTLAILFLIFVIAKSSKAKKDVARDEYKGSRVVENTKPDR